MREHMTVISLLSLAVTAAAWGGMALRRPSPLRTSLYRSTTAPGS
jgi:hypothetical protein